MRKDKHVVKQQLSNELLKAVIEVRFEWRRTSGRPRLRLMQLDRVKTDGYRRLKEA